MNWKDLPSAVLGLALIIGCGPVANLRYTSTISLPESLPGSCTVKIRPIPDAETSIMKGASESTVDRRNVLLSLRKTIEQDLMRNVFDSQPSPITEIRVELSELSFTSAETMSFSPNKTVARLQVILERDGMTIAQYEPNSESRTVNRSVTASDALSIAVGSAMEDIKRKMRSEFTKLLAMYEGRSTSTPPTAAKPIVAQGAIGPLHNIAVAELQADGMSETDAAVIANLLRGELVKTGAFNVVEKRNMDKIMSEQAFQQTGCTTQDCAVRLGRILNVQHMIVGSCGNLLGKYFVNIRLVQVENGKAILADEINGRVVEEIQRGIKDMAARLAGRPH